MRDSDSSGPGSLRTDGAGLPEGSWVAWVNHAIPIGYTGLMLASAQGHEHAVKELIRGGADITVADSDGDTALDIANGNGHANIVQLLVDAADDDDDNDTESKFREVSASDPKLQLVFELLDATRAGDLRLVERCLSRSVECAQTTLEDMTSPLIEASSRGHDAIVNKLLSVGAPVDDVNARKMTALHLASQEGHFGIVGSLIAAGANVNAVDRKDNSALAHASFGGHTDVVRSLLQAGADVTHVLPSGMTALMLASATGQVETVKELLRARSNVNYVDSDGDAALGLAASGGHDCVVEVLIAAGANVHHTTKNGGMALLDAAGAGAVGSVVALVRAGANVNHANSSGTTCLIIAAHKGFQSIVEKLIAAGALVDQVDDDGDSALGVAAMAGQLNIVRVLLQAGASDKLATSRDHTEVANLFGNFRQSPMVVFACIARGDIDELRSVLDQHKNARDDQDRTPLHVAAQHSRRDMVQLLVFRGASVHDRDSKGWTPLHYSAQSGDVRTVTFLLAQGCQVDLADADGWSAIMVAARHGHIEVVRELRKYGADPSLLSLDSRNILHCAAEQEGSDSIIEHLLATGAALEDYINARDSVQSSPLHYAVRAENQTAVSALISRGADINAQDQAGETPLIIACDRGNSDIVRTLLAEGARTDLVSAAGASALSVAKSMELQSAVQLYHTSQQFHQRCATLLSDVETKPTPADLKELVPLITSAYDLRLFMSLISLAFDGEPSDQCTARGTLLNTALNHVTDSKLVFDDDACVFFKLVLEHCTTKKWISRREHMMLDRLAEKINNENADWVLELQRKVHDHSWRLDSHQQSLASMVSGIKQLHGMALDNRKAIHSVHNHVIHIKTRMDKAAQLMSQLHSRTQRLESEVVEGRQVMSKLVDHSNQISDRVQQLQTRMTQSEIAVRDRLRLHESSLRAVAEDLDSFRNTYNARLTQEAKNAKKKMYGGIVASIAGLVLAPVLNTAFSSFIDLMNPVDVFTAAFTDGSTAKLADFLTNTTTENALKPLVAKQFEKLAIPQDEFAMVLREGIALQHPELLVGERGANADSVGFVGTVEDAKSLQVSLMKDAGVVDTLLVDLESALKACDMELPTQRSQQLHHPIQPCPSSTQPPQRQHVAAHRRLSKVAVEEISKLPEVQKGGPMNPQADTAEQSQVKRPTQPKQAARTPTTTSATSTATREEVVFDEGEDPDALPFHTAVRESKGKLHEFCELVDVLAGENDGPSTVAKMQRRSTSSASESLSAAEYAYSLGHREVGDFLVALTQNMGVESRADATTQAQKVELLQDDADFMYIHIVNQCAGDVHVCEEMCEAIEGDGFAIDARIQANVIRGRSSAVSWMAVEYAAHLGYVDIVKHLMKLQGLPGMQKIQLLKQAKERTHAIEPKAASSCA